MTYHILQIGLLEEDVVGKESRRIGVVALEPIIKSRPRIGIASDQPILLASILRIVDRLIDKILYLECSVDVSSTIGGTLLAQRAKKKKKDEPTPENTNTPEESAS